MWNQRSVSSSSDSLNSPTLPVPKITDGNVQAQAFDHITPIHTLHTTKLPFPVVWLNFGSVHLKRINSSACTVCSLQGSRDASRSTVQFTGNTGVSSILCFGVSFHIYAWAQCQVSRHRKSFLSNRLCQAGLGRIDPTYIQTSKCQLTQVHPSGVFELEQIDGHLVSFMRCLFIVYSIISRFGIL